MRRLTPCALCVMNRAMKSIVALLFGLLLCFPAMSEAQSNRLVYGEQIHAGR